MDIHELAANLYKASDVTITVTGDYCLDKYLYIDVEKDEKSLETGLTAYQVVKKAVYPGGAGTVVNNLRALGVNVLCAGIIGDDGEGYELLNALKKIGADTSFIIADGERCTSTYTKPMRSGAEINRLDFKNFTPMSEKTQKKLIGNLYAAAEKSDAIIVIDQFVEKNCNAINERVRNELSVIADKYPDLIIFADSRAYIHLFNNVMIKCNTHEINDDGESLYWNNKKPVFITMGENGSTVYDKNGSHKIAAVKTEGPVDFCGAGDAYTSGTVLGLTLGAPPEVAAMLGSAVSSITVKQIGVTGTATREQVVEVIRGMKL